ncbi:16S rRNA (cytidine(1402)-2'-O)-methyltransferase [Pelovirga terrestris]|uniref:Ribosomal RNA small subunit methyltransferase I n=1 Tax=Pelovirga terrestris TaxID=2771352 RepID=A0A8J6UI28_9BACT|nr:16S rRNA (cytidine(1402)-2'-O)-methyltransferase [Pelovirga terrestris]
MTGILYVVATPIGNLEDMTYRAVRVLGEVALIAAEDTRHSRKLLNHYGISTRLISYHDHNEKGRSEQLLVRLQGGENIALISDAGTPCIADPGYQLVQRCHHEDVPVVAIPGPSAVIAGLSIAGLPTEGFRFLGFLPAKTQARRTMLQRCRDETATQVMYEAPHRLLATLADIVDICGSDCRVAIARELTKRHEELFAGMAAEALSSFSERDSIKGELVIMLGPAPPLAPAMTISEQLLHLRQTTRLSWKEIVKQVARDQGVAGSEVYRESLALRKKD